MRAQLVGGLLALSCLLLAPKGSYAQEVKWRYEYASARREAESKGLPLVIDFGTTNCPWCVKLDNTTLRDPTIVQMVNERFIPLKLDGNQEKALVEALSIRSYPTVVLAGPDGKILGTMEGYHEPQRFYDNLQRAMTSVTNPEWMLRDYQAALKARSKGDLGRAVALLRTVVEDGKGRPVQVNADRLLKELEQEAQGRLTQAKQMHDRGQTAEAMETLTVVVRDFAGTAPAREAADLLGVLAKNPEVRTQQQARRAKELLMQAKKDFEARQFLACIDRCETLSASYGDRPEAAEAMELVTAIKNNPEWIQTACDNLSDRLGTLYLALAETWVKKGQPQQAVLCLERIVRVMPGSRQAEVAQVRLTQLRGDLLQGSTSQKPGP
jgi:thioredoxin-like negative regulator of GroEL